MKKIFKLFFLVMFLLLFVSISAAIVTPYEETNVKEFEDIAYLTIETQNKTWQKIYGGSGIEYANSIQQTVDGGYIVAGNNSNSDIYVLKLDANGNVIWQKAYGEKDYEYAKSIQQTKDGGYIIAGGIYSLSVGNYQVYLLKLDAGGNATWTKTYGGRSYDHAYSIQQTNDGGYITTGYTGSFGAGGYDVYVLKLNEGGELEWQKTYGGSGEDYSNFIQQTTDGGYIVAGWTYSSDTNNDAYILKLDSNGNVIWQNTYGGNGDDKAYSIQQVVDGGYIVAGTTSSSGAGGYDIYVLKLDENGNTLWTKTFGGKNDDYAYSIQQTNDGGYIVAGYTSSFGAGDKDVYVLKLDKNGDEIWTKTFGGKREDNANSIQQTNDGGYIVAGYTASFGAGGWDVYVIKMDANGNTGPNPQ